MKAIFSKLLNLDHASASKADLHWIAQLSEMDDVSAIEQSITQLKKCFAQDPIHDGQKLRLLLHVDQENRYRLKKLTQHFVNFQNIRPDLDKRLSDAVYYYHRQIFVSYRDLIQHFFHDSNDLVFDYKQLHLVIGRALNAAYSMAMWRHYNHQPVADMTWMDIHGLVRILEQEAMLNMSFSLYKGEPEEHLAASYIRACMQASLDQSGLTRPQIDTVHFMLQQWLPWITITRHHQAEKHLFYTDLGKDMPAKRIRTLRANEDCRFWQIDQFVSKLDATLLAIDQGQPHDLEAIEDKKQLMELLLQIRAEWSRDGYKRERRAENRNRVVKSVAVMYELQEIFQYVHNNPKANIPSNVISLEERLQSHRMDSHAPVVLYRDLAKEHWMISDESPGGLGIVVSHALNPKIKLGKLIGLKIKNSAHGLSIGTIRSIKNLANGQYHLGIKLLSRNPSWVQLSHLQFDNYSRTESRQTTQNGILNRLLSFPGLYLPKEAKLSRVNSLILPRMEFTEHSAYRLTQGHEPITIRLASSMESRDDWVRVRYPE